MLSEKQLKANRENAKKSTGPKSAGGKRISSQNALTHGLFAKAVLLPGESLENFNSLHRAYINEFIPIIQQEFDLIETLTMCRWRIRRVWTLEASSLSSERRAQTEANAVGEATPDEDPSAQYVRAHKTLCLPPRSLEVLSREEARYHRTYNGALDRLHRMLEKRKNTETNPQLIENNEPYPISKAIRTVNEPAANPQRSLIEPELLSA